MTDLHAGMILAAVQVIVMFGGMRAFYGCWPWEYRKTWYATKPPEYDSHWRNEDYGVPQPWLAKDPLEQLIVPTPPDIADSLQRNEESGDSFER